MDTSLHEHLLYLCSGGQIWDNIASGTSSASAAEGSAEKAAGEEPHGAVPPLQRSMLHFYHATAATLA